MTELGLRNIRTTTCEVTNMLGISFDSVQSTLTDNLSMCLIVAKSVPCIHEH